MLKNLRSWKTTIVGILAAVAAVASQLHALLDGNPETVFSYEVLAAGLVALGIGFLAKDGDKSTADVSD